MIAAYIVVMVVLLVHQSSKTKIAVRNELSKCYTVLWPYRNSGRLKILYPFFFTENAK